MPASTPSRTTGGRGRLYDSVLDTIGDTPSIRVNRLAPAGVRVYVKAEYFNPASSVKDRLAISIIEEAERRGDLKPGQTVVEATSGNTGIGLAMVCAAKGYPLVVTMADSFSIERRRLMRFLGAKVVLTPRAAKGFGMYAKAKELAETHGWFLARQFETADNAKIHENTSVRRRRSSSASRRTRRSSRAASRRPAPPIRDRRGATRPGRPIRSRAGRPTSSPSSCRRRSTGGTATRSSRSRVPSASPGPESSPSRRGSSPGSPAAPRSRWRCSWPRRPSPGR
jgi:hypothetical protein